MFYRFLLLILPLLLAGCGSVRSYEDGPTAALYQNQEEPTQAKLIQERKVLYAASLRVVVKEPDTAVAKTVRLATAYNGFMTSTSNTTALIRVPADRFESAMEEIATYGKLKDKSITGEDVTEAYLDLGIRLENAEKSRSRYLELLARAETVEAALAVERELERLNEVIDRYKGQRQRMDQLERFSTIRVTFQQKAKLGPLGFIFKGLYSGVRWLFVRNP